MAASSGTRANWKGVLRVGELSCRVALYTAASSSDRIAFHMLNRRTGNRLQRQFADSETGAVVEREDQVKGYESNSGDYIVLEPEEVAAAVPESDKTLAVSAFIRCSDVDDIYFDRPYFLAPADREADEAYELIRAGMSRKKVAALAQTVLFRRVRSVLIRAEGDGLVATTLNFNYEVRSAENAFSDVPSLRIEGEMLQLAEHIIKTKAGTFDPAAFDDRYEAALAELVKAKLEGRKIVAPKRPRTGKVVDLMEALRESAGLSGSNRKSAQRKSAQPTKETKSAAKGGNTRKTARRADSKTAAKTAPARRRAG
ncbi:MULTISPECIES: Ku protein [unclassified Chelatococcus]|uniref:non-homologous end joining protein Ku n=1 Tax=unclassified Chelatococcus TaxID=2638111 RepID=UPI001BD0E6E5|nr:MULTISPECIES: Ku protein [unclassified Chelatococcus]MBS7700796.1 Ku protein [Chelatococcus sp. YT9]MBX3559654.1 Ku protein [Chelatococcus sp.]